MFARNFKNSKIMKIKVLQLLFLCIIAVNCYGQTEKGKFLIGVNSPLSFSSTSTESTDNNGFSNDNKNKNFTIAPKVGYAVIDDLFLGLDVNLNFAKNGEGDDALNYFNYTLAPFAKYYVNFEKISLYGEFSYGFGKSDFYYSDFLTFETVKDQTDLTNLKAGLGLAYFLNDNFSFEFGLNYLNSKAKLDYNTYNTETITKSFNASVGFSLFL